MSDSDSENDLISKMVLPCRQNNLPTIPARPLVVSPAYSTLAEALRPIFMRILTSPGVIFSRPITNR